MKEIKQLERLAGLGNFRSDDKEKLLPLLEKYGIEKPSKRSCNDCWRDAAIMALRSARKEAGIVDADPVRVLWMGTWVTKEQLAKIREATR